VHDSGTRVVALSFSALLAGCTPAYQAPPVISRVLHGPTIYTPEQTVELENSDRVARFKRLANLSGITPPTITVEQEGSFPVVRVVFSERVMFDFDSDIPRREAMAVIDLVADNMRHDVPDAQLTLLCHTDAIGSDAYNYDLSMRRAKNVFQALVDSGCSREQLSTVAIGKNQPIAPNDTEAGRFLNRRVEFLISANQGANLAVVESQNIDPAYLRVNGHPVPCG
jgi:outer membrane protein OmpA-like peptidoglycan-associated protein